MPPEIKYFSFEILSIDEKFRQGNPGGMDILFIVIDWRFMLANICYY